MNSLGFSQFNEEFLMSLIERVTHSVLDRKSNEQLKYIQHQYNREDEYTSIDNYQYDDGHDWCRDEHCDQLRRTCPNSYDWYMDEPDIRLQHANFDNYEWYDIDHIGYRASNRTRQNSFIPPTQVHGDNDKASKVHESFYFSGLKTTENPKTCDVEYFLLKIHDHMQTDGILPHDMLDYVSQYLYGPALNWCTISKGFIHSWDLFKHEFRNRFSTTNDTDDIVIDIGLLFPNSNVTESHCQSNSRVSDPIISSDNQQSLLTSVMETLPPNSQDDSLNCDDEIHETMDDLSFIDKCSRSYENSFESHRDIKFESNPTLKNHMIRSSPFDVDLDCQLKFVYSNNSIVYELLRNFKKRKKKYLASINSSPNFSESIQCTLILTQTNKQTNPTQLYQNIWFWIIYLSLLLLVEKQK